MREIKFRAWNRKTGAMEYYDEFFIGESLMPPVGGWQHREPMQYTGLKDKNGKEIWESDYLLRPRGNLLKGEQWQEVKAPVRYVAEHGGFCWADWRLDKDMAATCEVVGNEYEGDI